MIKPAGAQCLTLYSSVSLSRAVNEFLCDYVNAAEGDSKGISESVSETHIPVFVWVQPAGLWD